MWSSLFSENSISDIFAAVIASTMLNTLLLYYSQSSSMMLIVDGVEGTGMPGGGVRVISKFSISFSFTSSFIMGTSTHEDD